MRHGKTDGKDDGEGARLFEKPAEGSLRLVQQGAVQKEIRAGIAG